MDNWKTSTKRFVPRYKTHFRQWRMEQLEIMVDTCPICGHDITMHFYEADYPEFCFCQVTVPKNCECPDLEKEDLIEQHES